MDLKRLISTFTYRIEPKPQGGFIAHATDPNLPPIEAPTREELQQKIQANIGAGLAREFPGLNLPSGNLPPGNQGPKFAFHVEAKPGGGFSLHSHDSNTTTIEGASHEEIGLPFAEKLFGAAGYLLPELNQALAKPGSSGDVKVFVDRKVGFTAKPGAQKLIFGGTQNFQPTGTLQPMSIDNSPLTFEKSTAWPIFRFLLALLVAAGLAYFFLHR